MKGDVFLLKGGDGAGPEVFTTIDALRGTALTINGEVVDATSKSSPGNWRELLDGGGVKRMSISADGVWESTAEQELLRDRAMDGVIRNYQITDSEDTLEGAFVVTNFELSGPHGAEQTYSVTLESADQPTIT